MKNLKPEDIKVILATDCGSTTTKAILIEYHDGEYRLIVRGEAPTTVEAPFEDVTMGVLNAIGEVGSFQDGKSSMRTIKSCLRRAIWTEKKSAPIFMFPRHPQVAACR